MPGLPELRDIAVVLVAHNDRGLLLDALLSVRGAPEIVVVDNASTDGTAEAVRRAFPEVRVLESPNDGYGAGANRGIAACSAPCVLLLNSDVVVRPGALRALADFLESHPRAGLAGPRLENPDGTLQRSCFDFLGTVRLAVEKTVLGRWLGVLGGGGGWSVHYGPYDRPRTAPWVLGAALAIRREAFEAVGGFDPAFFLYGEEVDLCYRLWQEGWEVHYAPSATVMHVGGASTRAKHEARRVESARLFYRRHYPPLRAAALDGLIRTAMRLRCLRDSLRLRLVRDDRRRSRLAEDLAVWRGILRGVLETD